MADTTAQAEIRGININKMVTGFADESLVLRMFLASRSVNAREVRWYKKTAGFLTSPTTTGMTTDLIETTQKALPVVLQQSTTRLTSYVKKWFAESETISMEDINDNDVDIFGIHLRDIVRAVQNQEDTHAYDILTESLSPSAINTTAAAGTGWDDATNGNPYLDLINGAMKIKQSSYDGQIVVYINPIEEKNLKNWLVTVKGSSVPAFSSEQIKNKRLMEIDGQKIVVSNNATTDYALQFVQGTSATWNSFMGLTSAVVTDEGIGKKIRVWEEGICTLDNPLSVHLVTDTVT